MSGYCTNVSMPEYTVHKAPNANDCRAVLQKLERVLTLDVRVEKSHGAL